MRDRKKNKTTRRKRNQTQKQTQKGGMCPCVYQSMMQKEKQKKNKNNEKNKNQTGGVIAALITQFNNGASLLTPIGAAFGIKAYRYWKKTRRSSKRK